MTGIKSILALIVSAPVLANSSAFAIDNSYMQKLEKSGCTQVTELQGCDINKTRKENRRAGFDVTPRRKPRYKDLVHQNSIVAIDVMSERGFKNVDSISSGSTQYAIYYHSPSQLCIQMTMADGEVLSVDNIHSHPKCR